MITVVDVVSSSADFVANFGPILTTTRVDSLHFELLDTGATTEFTVPLRIAWVNRPATSAAEVANGRSLVSGPAGGLTSLAGQYSGTGLTRMVDVHLSDRPSPGERYLAVSMDLSGGAFEGQVSLIVAEGR